MSNCILCGHASHAEQYEDCEESVGYTHLLGDTPCGCPGDPADRVLAVLPDECWVFRMDHDETSCFDLIGGLFPGGTKFTFEMCCLPCKVRAVLR